MPSYQMTVNGVDQEIEAEPNMPLLWVLRDLLGLVGTKFGCGIAQCGACTVHIDDIPMPACSVTVAAVAGRSVRTIEGLADGAQLHPLQKEWIAQDVAQCGYCQSGQLMSAAALLKRNPNPTDDDIDDAMAGSYCRCGTYIRIRSAIHSAASQMAANYVNAAEKKV
ncbi:MAG: (2Fe-2S)-binding protein [Gammaproteobacteria bacterium]|nr:(2Fe-2S)-binding protein [Gammaproteobacteria bacterium]